MQSYKEQLPLVTVIMPVYNGGVYLRDAMESILNQEFSNFEFLIIDDGSTDDSIDIVRSYKDSRILLICNTSNLGISEAVNRGIENAHGLYIARMDCDDISLPERLKVQVTFMQENPQIDVCGGFIKTLGEKHEQIWPYEAKSDEIKCMLLFRSALANPSVVMRKSIFLDTEIRYNRSFRYAQDYDLWVRLAQKTSFANIPDVLLYYRLHSCQVSTQHNKEQQVNADVIRLRQIHALGIKPTQQEFEVHQILSRGTFPDNLEFIELANAWLNKLKAANISAGYYPEPTFTQFLSTFLQKYCVITPVV